MSVRHVLFSTVDNLVKKKQTHVVNIAIFICSRPKCDKDNAPTFDKNTYSRQHFIGLKQWNILFYTVIFKKSHGEEAEIVG